MKSEPTEINSPVIHRERGDGLKYVLISTARNEAAYIEQTIMSVIGQTLLPLKWIIVSDGSTDGTDDIVKKYASDKEWIELLRMPERSERNFSGKAHAFNTGYAKLKDMNFDLIGNIDADITFEGNFFEYLLAKFAENPSLGVAGTTYTEDSFKGYNYNIVNIEDVTGHCQLFRRECFEEIGGYIPIKVGGIDSVAVLTARMKGWKTRTFTERTCVHHRKVGGSQGAFYASFNAGKKDYYGGGHPVWEIFRSLYNMRYRPYVLGGLFMFTGYLSGLMGREKIAISEELVAFRRKEQIQRLKTMFRRTLRLTT
jgi:glycosyltransferase involved in cell wall biosynthesis